MKTSLRLVRLNKGGYNDRGRYFGIGEPLFEYDNGERWGHVRAPNRENAKEKVVDILRGATFYR